MVMTMNDDDVEIWNHVFYVSINRKIKITMFLINIRLK